MWLLVDHRPRARPLPPTTADTGDADTTANGDTELQRLLRSELRPLRSRFLLTSDVAFIRPRRRGGAR